MTNANDSGARLVLMDGDAILGSFPVFEKTFSSGNTGYHATGSVTLAGKTYNANLLFTESRRRDSKPASFGAAAGRNGPVKTVVPPRASGK